MSSEFRDRHRSLVNRRTVLAAAATGGIALVAPHVNAVPNATQINHRGSSLVATPDASPIGFRMASPVADFPLDVIREQRPVESTQPLRGGDLRLFIHGAEFDDFSPVSFRQDFQVACSLYDPLVWLDEVTCEPKPFLAESWTWSDDGLTLTFAIREGVIWHDGSSLTASDVAFSLICYQQDYASAVSGFFALVTDIRSLDDRTVAITFSSVDGSFLFNAGNLLIFQSTQYGFAWSSRPQGERSLTGYDWVANPPIGTGPWQFDSATESQVLLKRNEAYWAGPAHCDRMILTIENDPSRRLDA